MQFEEIYELALVGSVSTLVGARPVKSKYVVNPSQVVEKQGCNLEMGGGVGLIDPPTDLIETVSAHFYTGDIFGYSDIFLSRILTKTKC